MIVLDTTIVNVALPSIRDDLGFSRDLARLGRERLPAHLRRLPAARRPARRPLRPPPAVPDRASRSSRCASLACGLATIAGAAGRGAGGAGPRRRGRLGGRALADHDPLHRAGRAGEGDGRLRLRHGRRRQHRRAARRRPHRRAQLALDLPRQRPDRHRRLRALRCGCCRPTPGGRRAGGSTSPARSP